MYVVFHLNVFNYYFFYHFLNLNNYLVLGVQHSFNMFPSFPVQHSPSLDLPIIYAMNPQ